MGIFKRTKVNGPHRDVNSRTIKPIVLEKLEPRILLSGDGLLNISPNPLDALLDNTSQVIQYAELLDTNAQAEQQVSQELASSDNPNSDVYEPIFTLTQDDNTNGESVNADLIVGIVSSTQVNSEPDLQLAGSDVSIALVLGVDLFEDNGVQPIAEDVDSECFKSCQRQLILEQLTDTLRVPHGPPGSDGVLTSLDDVQLEYLLSGEPNAPASDSVVIAEDEILSGSGVFVGDLINYGTISPGNSPGAITIVGNLTIVGTDPDTIDDSYPTPTGDDTVGTIQIEIAGTDLDKFDHIHVTGNVTLGGTLEIVLLNDFIPDEGNTFDILTFDGTVDGAFDNATGLFGFGDGSLFFDVRVLIDRVQLVVKKAPGAGNITSSTQEINDVLGQFYSDYFTIDSSVTIAGELTIDDFVTLSGSFNFGIAPIQTVTVKTGLPGNVFLEFGATITGVDMLTLTIGAADVHAFVGLNAPYWTGDVDEDGKIDKADEDLNGDDLLNDGIANSLLDESTDDEDYNGDGDKDDVINEDMDGDGNLDVDETNPDAIGLAVTNLDIGFVLMKPDPLDLEGAALLAIHPYSLFYSLKATADMFEFVGWDEIILSAQQIEINVNNGVPWPGGLGTPVVDFATSYPAGFEVSTGGDPVFIDFGSKKIGFSSERITVQLSQFVHITGSFAFEKGPATWVNIATGLSADALDIFAELLDAATGTDLGTQIKNYGTVIQNVQVSTFQIGASNVHAFVGLNGPYWEEDLDGDGNISWSFDTGNTDLFPDAASRTITATENIDPTITVDGSDYTATVSSVLLANKIVTIDAADGWIKIGGTKYGDVNDDGVVDADETQELSEDAVGLVVNNLDVGFVTMAPTIGSFAQFFGIPKESLKGIIPKFTALKATAETFRFVGWDEIELSADMITINYQNGTEWLGGLGPPVVDFLNSFPAETIGVDDDGDGKTGEPAGFEVGTGGDPVYIDFDGNQRIGFSSERITLRLSEFVHITGSFAFEMGPVTNVNIATGLPTALLSLLGDAINAVSETTAGTSFVTTYGAGITGLEVSTFQIGASNVHAFVGLNGPYWVDDLDGDGNISWSFDTGNTDLFPDAASRTITAITDLDGMPLSSVDIDGTSYSVDDVLPPDMVVTLSGSELVTVNDFTYGDIDGDGIVDANETQELSEEAVGLVVNDLDVGFVMMEPTIASFLALLPIPEHILKAIIPKFMALKATADSVEFVGVDEVQFSLQGITINYNNGTEWPAGLGPPVVDFLSSFPGEPGEHAGFEVGTGGDPVYIDFDGNQRIGAIVEKVTLQISEFVHVTGSIAFEMGPVQTVDVTGGLLSELGGTVGDLLTQFGFPASLVDSFPAAGAETTEVSFMTIGASNVHAFVGLDGPYWTNDLDGNRNISWSFQTGSTTESRTINSLEKDDILIDGMTYYSGQLLPVDTVITLSSSNGWIEVNGVKYGDIDGDGVVDANETAELSEKAAGIVINDFDFGMAIMTPTFPLDFARYFALRATAEEVALVGIEDVTLEATHLLVEVNLSSPSVYGLPLFPVVDFLSSFPAEAIGEDDDGDGKTGEPAGFEVETGGDPVYLSMDSPLIRAQGFVELDLFGVVTLIGNFAFELGPTITDPTLTDGSVLDETLTTLTIGASNVFGFIGWDGPYFVDGNENQQIDVDEDGNPLTGEVNPAAVGLALSDLNVGILIAVSPMSVDAFVAVDFEIDQIAFVGLDFLTASATLALDLNIGGGLNSGLAAIDFLETFPDKDEDGPDQAGFEVNTGDPEAPVLLDFEEVLVSIELAGELTIANTVSMLGIFFLETGGQSFKLFATADLEIGPDIGRGGNSLLDIHALGVVSINDAGFAADLAINLDVGIDALGLSVAARVLINTTGDDQEVIVPDRLIDFLEASTSPLAQDVLDRLDNNSYLISGYSPTFIRDDGTPDLAGARALLGLSEDAVMFETTPGPYAVVVLYGSFDFVGFVTANGMGAIALRSGAFEMLVDLDYNLLGSLEFSATGALGLFDDGITVYLDTSLDANIFGVFRLKADGTLDINTRDTGSDYFSLEFSGDLSLLSVINLSTEGSIEVKDGWWTAQLSVSGNFLSLFSVSGSVELNSEGEFVVDVHGDVQLGPDWINIHGSADLLISYQDEVLYVSGSLLVGLTIDIWPFPAINLDLPSLTVEYNAGEITVSVTYWEPYWASGWLGIPYPSFREADYTFHIGTFTIDPPPLPVLGQVDGDGVLTLNVGPNAGARKLLVDEVNEDVTIDRVGDAIRISMFGYSQLFYNVSEILISDMGDGDDVVEILPGVTVPVKVHFGPGGDRLRNAGSGVVIAYGDGDDDCLEGGSANDQLFGGLGSDFIDGKAGQDWIDGGDGSDLIIGGADDDIINGGPGVDRIMGDLVNVTGDETTSVFQTIASALGGNDIIEGGDGADVILGGSGNDVINGGAGEDLLIGDDGTVTFSQQGMTFTLTDSLFSGNDIIDGGADNDTIFGQEGDDILLGGGGDDELYGDEGGDCLEGGSGNDWLFGGADNDILDGGADNDTLFGQKGEDILLGGEGDDHLYGDEGDDCLEGGSGNDWLFGGAGNDILDGGADNDTLYGQQGEDILIGGIGDDFLYGDAYALGTETVGNILLGDGGTIIMVDGLVTEIDTSGESTGGSDTIWGNGGVDIVMGGAAMDMIYGDAGDDILLGDTGIVVLYNGSLVYVDTEDEEFGGSDTIHGDMGDDIIIGGLNSSSDILYGDAGDDIILGDNGFIDFSIDGDLTTLDLIRSATDGLGGGDFIYGNAGSDVILGGTGGDEIQGNDDPDILIGDNADIFLSGFVPGSLTILGSAVNKITTTDDQESTGGADLIYGDEGDDIIMGGASEDTIHGGAGTDLIFGDQGDVENGGEGTWVVTYDGETPPWFEGYSYASTQTESDNAGAGDTIYGEDGGDYILGQQGQDVIFGGNGDDDIYGGHNVAGGHDTGDVIDGGTGNDVIAGDNAIIQRTGGALNPRMRALQGVIIYGEDLDTDGEPLVTGDSQIDPTKVHVRTVVLFDQSDTPDSNTFGDDTVAGGADDDMIFGQLGNDTLHGDGQIIQTDGAYTLGSLTVGNSNIGGDDYIEGNGGDDTIYGGLGQDDIIGGSSTLFGLTTLDQRPDGSDTIYGGNGDMLARNNLGDGTFDGHARDADVILGDNGNIYRLVGTNGTDSGNFLGFNYDDYGSEKIIVRAAELLDYTPGGSDYDAVNAANDNGAPDEIHGESGDDFLYGMKGDDVIFGEGQDDDIIGGYGNDWISGGTGDDGVLGDDGRIYTSRNGTAEPLYGIGNLAGELDKRISTQDKKQQATINVSGELKKTVDLTPFKLGDPEVDFDPLHADDIIFGGWGNDFLHGGDGDDAISGAEALTDYYDKPVNTGDVLKYGVFRAGEFGAYNKNDPLSKVYWNPATGEFVTGGNVEFLLNFDHTEGAPVDSVHTDGDDVIFGDLGNDWLVGGTGRDHMYGGWGCDLLNADDNLDTAGGANNEPNGSETSYEDLAYGGAGPDVLIANIIGDRLIDWVGDFNTYVLPYTSFGVNTISRNLKSKLFEFLYDLSRADGADRTLGDSDDPRNGEPNGELGLVMQKDPDWENQTSDG